jgi:hypothetical protein
MGDAAAGNRRRLFGVNRISGLACGWRIWRRSRWKYWAGVVALTA